MVSRFTSILTLTAIIGHMLFGCACQHARAAVDDEHRSETAAQTLRSGPSKSSMSSFGSMTIAAACASCGEHSDSVPHPCEDNCCTFVKSSGVQTAARLASSVLFLPVLSSSLRAVCRPQWGQMQNTDAAPTGRPLSVDSREWLASWLL